MGQQEKKVGITGLRLNFKNIDPDYFFTLEDTLTAEFTEISFGEKYMLSINTNSRNLREIVKHWSNDTSSDKVESAVFNKTVSELEQVDFCIFVEVNRFLKTDRQAFYDSSATEHEIFIELRVITIDCTARAIVDEALIESRVLKNDTLANVKKQSIEFAAKKFLNELKNSDYLKRGFALKERKPLFVWLEGGFVHGIRRGQYYSLFSPGGYGTDSELFVKIVKVEDEESMGIILYDSIKTEDKDFQLKKLNKIGLELQINGGVLLANMTTGVTPLPMFTIRGLIPVRLVFFRPVVQVEFNFIYLNNTVLMPFFFQTGAQGEINFKRFGMNLGGLIGAFFTPDESGNYTLDSLTITPYFQVSVLLSKTLKLYGEAGYNFITVNKFKETWNVDLSGVYVNAGIAILL